MKLALQLPWKTGTTKIDPAYIPTETKFNSGAFQLADAINSFAQVAIYVGAFLMFFWMAWGVFDYIRAEGNKESLAKARKRIQWAITGFIILLVSFFISDFVQDTLLKNPSIWQRGTQPVQNLTRP